MLKRHIENLSNEFAPSIQSQKFHVNFLYRYFQCVEDIKNKTKIRSSVTLQNNQINSTRISKYPSTNKSSMDMIESEIFDSEDGNVAH